MTPTLSGKDADKFLTKMLKKEKEPITKKDREMVEKIKDTMKFLTLEEYQDDLFIKGRQFERDKILKEIDNKIRILNYHLYDKKFTVAYFRRDLEDLKQTITNNSQQTKPENLPITSETLKRKGVTSKNKTADEHISAKSHERVADISLPKAIDSTKAHGSKRKKGGKTK